jgi:23S rRNA pseudouridine1911/1915/1917 synthase
LAKIRRFTVPSAQPLLVYLLSASGLKRPAVKNLLKFGAVAVNGKEIRQFDHPLSAGDEVTLGDPHSALATSRLQHAGIQPVYEDESLIVVDKPTGLLTVATDKEKQDTLFVRLNEYLHGQDPARPARGWVVHRLDQDTSGLVLFAKSESVKAQLQEMWPSVIKTYFAVVESGPPEVAGTVTTFLSENRKSLKVYSSDRQTPGARQATTHYRLLKSQDGISLLEVRLETGRKHQIRVHLAGLRCPVVGDQRYGATSNACRRLALHACRLEFKHPVTAEPLSFQSPLPAKLNRLIS